MKVSRLLLSTGFLFLPIVGFSQQFRLESLDATHWKIHADKADLAVEENYSRFDCDAHIEQTPKLEYLEYAQKQRRIYTFPLILVFKNAADRQCLWWLRPCTHQECYFPIQVRLNRDAVTLTQLSKLDELREQAQPEGAVLTPLSPSASAWEVWLDRVIRRVMAWTVLLGLILGMIAGINPCNLPLIPLIFHYSRHGRSVWGVTLGSFLAIAGLMGIVVGSGKLLGQTQLLVALGNWVHLIFSVILIGFGLWAIKGSFDWLQQWMTHQAQDLPKKRMGGFFWGMVFAFLSLPCVGPILALYGVLLFNAQRPPVVSVLSFSLGFVSWFFLWAWLGKRLRSVSQKMFKGVEIAIGVVFIVLGVWRGIVFVQGVAQEAIPYEVMIPELAQEIHAWSAYTKVSEFSRVQSAVRLYFFSAQWCVECQPYMAPLKRWKSKGAPIRIINVDSLEEGAVAQLRSLGILGVPAFVWVTQGQVFIHGSIKITELKKLLDPDSLLPKD